MFVEGSPEAGPAGAAVVLPVGFEQGQVAAGTDVGASAVFVVQFTAAGEFGLREAQHLVLLWCQALAPGLVAEVELLHGRRGGVDAPSQRGHGGAGSEVEECTSVQCYAPQKSFTRCR